MYQLYINRPKSSWSLRPWILLKVLNIPFEQKIVRYLDDLSEQRTQFKNFSPTSKIPVLNVNGNVIWDSLAIVEFIAEDYPQVWAEEKFACAWSRSVCAEMHSGFEQLRSICNFDPLNRIQLTYIPTELEKELQRIDELWQQGLSSFGRAYLAAEQFTAVDAFFVPVALRVETYGLHQYLSDTSLAYQKRLLALPALQEWLNG